MRKIKLLSFLLLIFCFSSLTGVSAEALPSNEVMSTISMSGVSMSRAEFTENFSGNPKTRTTSASVNSFKQSKISITNVSISDDNISLSLQITTDTGVDHIPVTGKLRSSFKTQKDINSVIVEVQDSSQNYDILLFEIYNDSGDDTLLLSDIAQKTYADIPHIKIYIQDQFDKIYLFEDVMPNCFSTLDASLYPRADIYSDSVWWASDLVVYNDQNLPTDQEMLNMLGISKQTRDPNTLHLWTHSTTFHTSFYSGSSFIECWSLPYLEYVYTNVTPGADTTWTVQFKVAEHIEINGVTFYGNNAYQYRNLTLSLACGDKTRILRTMQEGRFVDSLALIGGLLENGANGIAVSLLKYTLDRTGNATLASVVEILSNMSSTSATVCLGTNGVNLMESNTTAAGENLAMRYLFRESTDQRTGDGIGHYFTFQAVMQYLAGSGYSETVGVIGVSFGVDYNSELTMISDEIPLYYTAA